MEGDGVAVMVDRDGWVHLAGRRSPFRFHQNQMMRDGRTLLQVMPDGRLQNPSGREVARLNGSGEARRGEGRFFFDDTGELVGVGPAGERHPTDFRLIGAADAQARQAAMVISLMFMLGMEGSSGAPEPPVPGR